MDLRLLRLRRDGGHVALQVGRARDRRAVPCDRPIAMLAGIGGPGQVHDALFARNLALPLVNSLRMQQGIGVDVGYGESDEMLDGPVVVKDNVLNRTSAWANTFRGRDHNTRRDLPS